QLLSEDYYAVNKLAKGFLGTNNVDSNSRLCMSSAVAGYTGAFGADGPPPAYADIGLADCLLLLGTNTAACPPIVWSRVRDRRRVAAAAGGGGVRRAGRGDRRGGAALRRRRGGDGAVVDGREPVDRRDAEEPGAHQPLPGDGEPRPPGCGPAVADRPAERDGRP